MLLQLVCLSFFSFDKIDMGLTKETPSPYKIFFYLYLENFSAIENLNSEFVYEELKRLGYQDLKKHEDFFKLAEIDKANFKNLKKVQEDMLNKIDPSLKEVYQIYDKLASVDKEERKKSVLKFKDSCAGMGGIKKSPSRMMEFYWNTFLFAVIASPIFEFDEEFQKQVIGTHLIPSLSKKTVNLDCLSDYNSELHAECKFRLYLFEGNYIESIKEINIIYESRNKKFTPGDVGRSRPLELKIELLMRQKKYHDVIREFKTIPEKWLDQKEGLDSGSRTLFITNAAIAYNEIGNKELSKVWQELSYSEYCSDPTLAGKEFVLKQALLLRKLYLEEKSWILMRNLEERSAKFGMTPLPKQPGEN